MRDSQQTEATPVLNQLLLAPADRDYTFRVNVRNEKIPWRDAVPWMMAVWWTITTTVILAGFCLRSSHQWYAKAAGYASLLTIAADLVGLALLVLYVVPALWQWLSRRLSPRLRRHAQPVLGDLTTFEQYSQLFYFPATALIDAICLGYIFMAIPMVLDQHNTHSWAMPGLVIATTIVVGTFALLNKGLRAIVTERARPRTPIAGPSEAWTDADVAAVRAAISKRRQAMLDQASDLVRDNGKLTWNARLFEPWPRAREKMLLDNANSPELTELVNLQVPAACVLGGYFMAYALLFGLLVLAGEAVTIAARDAALFTVCGVPTVVTLGYHARRSGVRVNIKRLAHVTQNVNYAAMALTQRAPKQLPVTLRQRLHAASNAFRAPARARFHK